MNFGFASDFANSLFQASMMIAVFAVAMLLLLKLLRVRSPAIHRIAWLVVLIQGFVFSRVEFEIPWYEASTRLANQSPAGPEPFGEQEFQKPITDSENLAPDTAAVMKFASGHAPPESATTPLLSSPANPTTVNPSAVNAIVSNPVRVLSMVWFFGMAVLVVVQAASYLALLRALKQSTDSSGLWRVEWNQIMREHGVKSEIPLRIHPSLGPMICYGQRGYQVVVPRELWEELTPLQRELVLKHELAHFLRGDVWKSTLVRLLAVPHWFNPMAWFAVRKFEESGEWACDQFLLEHDPESGTRFASALLKIVQFPERRGIGFSLAGGSFLRERVQRLCGQHTAADSPVKRAMSLMVLLVTLAIGFAEIQLVARTIEHRETTNQQEEEATPLTDPERIQEFHERIAESDAPLVSRFREMLQTPAGRTVLLERASVMESAARQEAQITALPSFLNDHFRLEGDQLVLQDDQQEFRQQVLQRTAEYQRDVDQIAEVLDELTQRMDGESEADKLLKRVFSDPTTAWVIYVTEIRNRVRPDERTILELYQSVFVMAPGGRIVIRPNVREQIEEQLALGPRRRQALKQVEQEFGLISDEIAEVDELHRQFKALLKDEYFVAFACNDSIRGQPIMDEQLQRLFQYFDRFLEDHSDGRHLTEQGRDQVQTLLTSIEGRRESAKRLEEPLRRFVSRIDAERDDLHLRVSQAFDTKLSLAMLTQAGEMRNTNPASFLRRRLAPFFGAGSDAPTRVRDNQQDAAITYGRQILQGSRSLRRRVAAVDQRIHDIQDESLRDALLSYAGKYLMIRSANQQVATQRFDGLGLWIKEHFVETENGLNPKEESLAEIERFVNQAAEVQKQLDKDDF